MEKIKSLKGYWVCVNERGEVEKATISGFRKSSIYSFTYGSKYGWEECKKYGWRCIKVNIDFTPVKN